MYKSLDEQDPGYYVNWVGVYIINYNKNDKILKLGPFQGKIACQSIEIGRGVCGAAAQNRTTLIVENVEEFPGHIACDGETKSEIVVPIIDKDGVLRGVLDLDCTKLKGFDHDLDKKYLEQIVEILVKHSDWNY